MPEKSLPVEGFLLMQNPTPFMSNESVDNTWNVCEDLLHSGAIKLEFTDVLEEWL